jgi:phage minor structural protein
MVDRLITLFESTDRDFSTNGIGPLPDAISCVVNEELNGPYELEMEYPITGQLYNEILFRRILYVKTTPYTDKQPFRIYAISKPISGIVTINAQHISYDLANYTVSPFSANTLSEAFEKLSASMDNIDDCPFEFWTDKEITADMGFSTPINARTILGGIEGSILDTYRGEYEWDCFTVRMWNNRGTDRGVTIRYGKNLTDIKQEENISEVYTAVRPYWYRAPSYVNNGDDEQIPVEDDSTGLVELTNTGKVVSSNLLLDSVKYGDDEDDHATIDDNGEIIETELEYKVMYAQIQNGIKYTIRCDSVSTVVGGFFREIPDIGSVAINGKEDIDMDEFTAPIDGYVAIVVGNAYTSSVIDRLPYNIVFVDAYSEYTRILSLDLTSEFDGKPTEAELALAAILYVNEHDLGSPKVSIEVSFVNLSDSSEYKDIALLEMVKMGDSVDIEFPKLGVSASAKVVKTHYDVLAGRYSSIELGSVKADLATTIAEVKKDNNTSNVTQSDLNEAIAEATKLITGQSGGYVVLNPPEHPQEIYILDEESGGVITNAVNVWRWNMNGLGFSSHGYLGPYDPAITYDGKIVADFIKSGSMSADRIFGGQLVLGKLSDNTDIESGSLIVYGKKNDNTETIIGEFNRNGLFLYGNEGFYLLANPDIGFAGMKMMPGYVTPTPFPVDPSHPELVDEKLFWINEDQFHMKRGVVEEDILFCGKIRIIPIDIYDSQDPSTKINDGIAFVASS